MSAFKLFQRTQRKARNSHTHTHTRSDQKTFTQLARILLLSCSCIQMKHFRLPLDGNGERMGSTSRDNQMGFHFARSSSMSTWRRRCSGCSLPASHHISDQSCCNGGSTLQDMVCPAP